MIGIRVATMLHFLWGIYLILFWYRVPQPFGGFEPYLVNVSAYTLGWIFLFIAVLALVKNFLSQPWWIKPVMVIPQQVVLFWGLLSGLYLIFRNWEVGLDQIDRMVLAMCYGVSITTFHVIDMFQLWHDGLVHREIQNGSTGNS